MTLIKNYRLKNLDCGNCAAKIERKVQELPNVRYASVNFATETLHLDTDNFLAVKDLIKKIEPEVEVLSVDTPEKEESETWNVDLVKILVAVLLFIGGIIFERQLVDTPSQVGEILVFGTAYLISGWQVLAGAARNSKQKNWFDENFLMSIATLGAIAIGEFPEAVGVMLFYQIGEYVQRKSVERSRNSIQSLLNLRPDVANLKRNGEIVQVLPDEISVGDIIVVHPGERVPLDGKILEGESHVDTSALTGESIPRLLSIEDNALSGMINKTNMLTIQVQKIFSESSVSKMLERVQNATKRKAKTEKFITKFAKVYSPIVVGIALIVAFIPPLVIPGATLSDWVYRALVILVISCPCALVISIPLGYFGGVGAASQKGILVKGANFLDVLADVETVIFDKTGTLTTGKFTVTKIMPANGWEEKDLLRLASQAEARSSHPIAQTIVQAYGGDKTLDELSSFEEISGAGIIAQVNGTHVIAGNDSLLHRENIAHDEKSCNQVGTVVHLAFDKIYGGYLVIEDALKTDAKDAISALHNQGVSRVEMLTGDQKDIAQKISEELSLDNYRSELLPHDKLSWVEKIMTENHNGKVAFVGDGINDAPALARSDVGIAMGAMGSDAAIETADVVLMTDAPSKVAEAINIGKRTRKIVMQNIIFAFIVKALFILLGIFGVASMWEAVFGDVGVTILAVLNSTRVLKA